MEKARIEFLKELTEASGVSGFELEIKNILKKHLKGLAEVEEDKLGSVIFKKQGASSGPKIMIPGHMDEVGFMVKSITEKGFIKFIPLGGWMPQVVLAQQVVIKSSKGDVTGVVGSKPPHLSTEEERRANKGIEMKDLFIDVSASSRKEVEDDFGIKPGDPIIPVCAFTQMKNRDYYLAKAFDNRIGCALFVEIIKALQNEKHPNTVYGVGTVQEETGLSGAKTSSWVVNPDVAIVAEISIAADVPGMENEDGILKMGQGPSICLIDRGMIPNLKLRNLVIETAKKHNIPFQYGAMTGGTTDGTAVYVHTKGVPCIYIGVPMRYAHSPAGIINMKDYENTLKLMLELIKVLDENKVRELVP
ncbi:MAG: peptidase M28 [Elusimicrobia bacterium RIFOXYA2_FULL_39_19]|nr:MAG: peptidase M28 [Elusimicrobia bacterium RIFOXYA2_FULL_39_19]